MRNLLVVISLAALPGSFRAEVVAKPPVFELHTAGGATLTGPLKEIGADWSMHLDGAKAVRIKGSDVISLRRVGLALPELPGGDQVVLANGGRLPFGQVTIADDRVRIVPRFPIRPEQGRVLSLPMSGVTVVWLAAPRGVASPRALLRRLASESRSSDVLIKRNGDRIEGTLLGQSPRGFRIKVEGNKESTVPRVEVAVAAFNTELVSRAPPKGVYGRLVLADGCRLAVTAAALAEAGRSLRARLPSGEWIVVPLSHVRALDLRQGCAVYLSDLKPAAYRHTPYFGVSWPYVADGSMANRSLRLAGSTYDKGLGMHSRSRLTYVLAKGYRRFEALVGLDDQTGRRGRVWVRVLRDGKPVAIGWNKELTARDRPLRVKVDVTGARELTLEVDFGRLGDVQSHVDWVDARLIR